MALAETLVPMFCYWDHELARRDVREIHLRLLQMYGATESDRSLIVQLVAATSDGLYKRRGLSLTTVFAFPNASTINTNQVEAGRLSFPALATYRPTTAQT